MRVEWRPLAEQDLAEIVRYIATDNPQAAYGVLEVIREQSAKLADYPEIGRAGRVRGTRELVIAGTPFVVPYRVANDIVTILRVMHGARKWPRAF
ncbi:type II toxin-antitoxin system RelE/ParE family toxin [Mesorhizobium xinjiangense]|uniref:type II toxin-antitoxin system RelE/ParE family toxin n=1 Tax=Mesorhizobium xinjiangense TaxID=2678685 RepID=UPI001F37DA99|nr:type II toxin-antitoxin system RelE/ParE family toxin [Mesorhizobium xinjiangense]